MFLFQNRCGNPTRKSYNKFAMYPILGQCSDAKSTPFRTGLELLNFMVDYAKI